MDASGKVLFDRVRKALLVEWDPIGIQDFPGAQDEYDSYVPDLCELLKEKVTVETIFRYLWQLETEHMGLSGNLGRTWAFAERLIRVAQDGA